jgi:tetratricopeptide (TPR) repeat protein
MRFLPTKKCIRGLFAAEGYLELNLPHRALGQLDHLENAGELEPYALYLRGQALQQLDRYEEAIEVLQQAARTIPAPFDRKVWEDLSECFRHEGLQELADIAELFADDPLGGSDRDLSECPSLAEFGEEFSTPAETGPWNRSASLSINDFEDYNFDEFGSGCGEESNPTPHKPPQK